MAIDKVKSAVMRRRLREFHNSCGARERNVSSPVFAEFDLAEQLLEGTGEDSSFMVIDSKQTDRSWR